MRAIGESDIKDKRTKGRDKEGAVGPELTAPGIQMHISHKKKDGLSQKGKSRL